MNTFHRVTLCIVVVTIGLLLVRGYPTENQTTFTECKTPADCGIEECCVIGMMRYSTPQCLPLGRVEDFCREDSEPENRTLYYPDGSSKDVVDVYTHVCPCDSGLQCLANTCSQSDNYENNYIY